MANKKIIRTRAPLRISFAGGGTDLNEVFEKYGGCVLNSTIDKHVYVEVKKGKGLKVNEKKPDKFTNNILKRLNAKDLDITTWYEVPYGRGLGSSSAYSVALASAILIYQKKNPSIKDVIEFVYKAEHNLGKCGWQDQMACAIGGLNLINFDKNKNKNAKVTLIQPLLKTKKELEKQLCLVFTGITHNSRMVHKKSKPMSAKGVKQRKKLVNQLNKYLTKGKIEKTNHILTRGWELKKQKATTNKEVDKLYKLGFKYGATGGKLLGAGAGGYILFFVPPKNMHDFRKKIRKKYEILNFKFSNNGVELW